MDLVNRPCLKIIAGVDKNYQGDVVFSQDYSVGYLEQEPKLDESKTVMEIVREGAAETVAILDEYNKINDMFGLEEVYSDADRMEKLMNRQAELQDQIDAANAWELDTKLEIAMDALRTPEGSKKISCTLWRRAPSGGTLPFTSYKSRMYYYWMSLPITWMQNRFIGWNIIWRNIKVL